MPTTLHENRPSAGIGVVEVQKPWFFAISKVPARPSAGIGVVEVQNPMVFLRFLRCSRDPLRRSAWSRCKNSRFFAMFNLLARPSAGIGVVEVQKPMVFLRFPTCPRDPLRGSEWSRCKNPWFFFAISAVCGDRRGRGAKTQWFFAISAVLARPSAGIGVVEVQNSRIFAVLLFELVLGSCLVVRAPAPGTGGSRVRFLPGPRAGVARCNLHFKATCAKQLAQSKLHNLRGATCAEQLAQCNLRRATCADQLAPTSLRRAPCLVLSRACFTNASCREKERILQRWADLACDVLLSGQPWSSFFGGGIEGIEITKFRSTEGPILAGGLKRGRRALLGGLSKGQQRHQAQPSGPPKQSRRAGAPGSLAERQRPWPQNLGALGARGARNFRFWGSETGRKQRLGFASWRKDRFLLAVSGVSLCFCRLPLPTRGTSAKVSDRRNLQPVPMLAEIFQLD